MADFSLSAYSPTVAALLANVPLNDLGPGRPDLAMHDRLAALTPEALAAPQRVVNPNMALACYAALWLRHDYLDDSHQLSQEIHTAEGSYWHAIMHRREPDSENSKYWFRRVGRHAIFDALNSAAKTLVGNHPASPGTAYLQSQNEWDPYRFVDLCEQTRRGPAEIQQLCMLIQQREWELLFDHCYRRAIAAA